MNTNNISLEMIYPKFEQLINLQMTLLPQPRLLKLFEIHKPNKNIFNIEFFYSFYEDRFHINIHRYGANVCAYKPAQLEVKTIKQFLEIIHKHIQNLDLLESTIDNAMQDIITKL